MGQVIYAIIAKFKLEGFDPDQLQLFKLEGSSRTLLSSTQTLCDAGIYSGTTLVVELAAAPAYKGTQGLSNRYMYGTDVFTPCLSVQSSSCGSKERLWAASP